VAQSDLKGRGPRSQAARSSAGCLKAM